MIRASLCRLPSVVWFCVAVSAGVLLAVLTRQYKSVSDKYLRTSEIHHSVTYNQWLSAHNISKEFDALDDSEAEKTSESLFLKKKVRVLCFVIPDAKSSMNFPFQLFQSQNPVVIEPADAVVSTWGKRCNKMVFFSSSPSGIPAGVSVLPLKNRPPSWNALKEAIIQVSNNYLNDFDWFLHADLETYVIMENLRYYLAVFDASQPFYIGHTFESWGIEFNTASAGFILSRGALIKLHNSFIKGQCPPQSTDGDVELGRCLSEIGILPQDSRDSGGHARFLVFDPETHLVPGNIPWTSSFWSKTKYLVKDGPGCCSDYAVTFNNVPASTLYILEYLVYHLKPFGISNQLKHLHSLSSSFQHASKQSKFVSQNKHY